MNLIFTSPFLFLTDYEKYEIKIIWFTYCYFWKFDVSWIFSNIEEFPLSLDVVLLPLDGIVG